MEVYVTFAEYQQLNPTSELSEADFNVLNLPAQAIIDEMTLWRIPPLDDWSADNQERIKRSVCAQIDTMQAQGGNNVLLGWGAERDYNSEQIGRYSYERASRSADTGALADSIRGMPISPLVKGFLFPTGLLYYGLGRCCR